MTIEIYICVYVYAYVFMYMCKCINVYKNINPDARVHEDEASNMGRIGTYNPVSTSD